MQNESAIRLLEKDSNRRGDLFGRLMADLFVALGYELPRLNVHKSGRELDLEAMHRLEPRRAIAECKATADTIGGDDINKFVGAIDAETDEGPPLTGYFISLAGFKETAVEQEKKRRRKIITLTGAQVVEELVSGRILISKDRAVEIAGRCCAAQMDLELDPATELLAHERGWMWAVYYRRGKSRTHFILIHSDGTPLARVIADEVISADKVCGGLLHELGCLNPAPPSTTADGRRIRDALAVYGRYIAEECGFIQLDGLPADSDVGSRRLRLESLFVPLNLDVSTGEEVQYRQAAGAVLAAHPRLAILAAPGGGKSTLIKRLAIAYADPARRKEVADDLPERDWLPLFFRCRELRGLARGSFAELLASLSQRDPVRQYADAFNSVVDQALVAGRILLLVDGLDEIADPGDRAAFVCTLRSALQAYPGTALIVTSREAGFRHVAGHLAPVCTNVTVSPLGPRDIRRLCVAWHQEVLGRSEKVRSDAEQLAASITSNDRIRRLAINPLLLTTLLLVKRWVGSLPTRRVVLYDKAVEVLLMTWNTEGHDPIPNEEALPQLCYLASSMLLAGRQRISRPRLAALLQEARTALPTELGYVKYTVEEFIHRVEDRSSLLMMTGHRVEDNRLVELFEFRHLTFQEFLAARAMVEGWHPGRRESDSLTTVLEPHFEEEEWSEVIPLAAVLGGKATEGLIRLMTERLSQLDSRHAYTLAESGLFHCLGNSLGDGAAGRPETIRASVREIVRLGSVLEHVPFTSLLAQGRYGADLRQEADKAFFASAPDFANAGMALAQAVWWQTIESDDDAGYASAAKRLIELLRSPDRLKMCEGALGSGFLFFLLGDKERKGALKACTDCCHQAGHLLAGMLQDHRPPEQYAACCGLLWLGACRIWSPPAEPDLLARLFQLWRHSQDVTVAKMAVWALTSQMIEPRHFPARCGSISGEEFDAVVALSDRMDAGPETVVPVVLAWYRREPWSDVEIARRARNVLNRSHLDDRTHGRTIREVFDKLAEDP
jgi:hypothetical protein